MYDIAEQVTHWLADGATVHVGQIVATRGFSSRDPSAALAWTDDGARVGALIPGLDLEPPGGEGLVDITVSDSAAVGAGLSCGGQARVLVSAAASLPTAVWDRLRRREPMCIVASIDDRRTEIYTPANVRDAAQFAGEIPRLFARGTSATALLADDTLAVVTLWPTTTMLVVGDGTIATALADAAELLEWSVQVTNEAATATQVAGTLTESDAFVVLSHDRSVDVLALAAVLRSRCGYVGALGSRGTQAARRDGLSATGFGVDTFARIHGPAGLDIDAHTPGEIAVSIVAEILASRSGTSGGPISGRAGPVHTGGVHAPPPRY